ncbi:Bug family tripartite tricarboxylate transporter substrate binding protein, partial [Variovorax sp. CT11-76]
MTPIAPLRRRLGALFLACLAAPSLALAQAPYPSKPIRLVVPFAAGGAVDTVGRVVGERLSTQMGQPVIVDNRPGANANIGTENVARSAPDGYSLLVAANGVVTNNTLYPKLSFNGLRDFVAVARLGYAPLVLVVPASAPYKSVPELLAAARAKPGDMSYGSAGNGSSG